ncbi:MAG: GNAT family N-acetyltransferase [Rickettsiales bacterium]|nr:GNAT family N-acetyltransferase [Rickettsiales bacterium]
MTDLHIFKAAFPQHIPAVAHLWRLYSETLRAFGVWDLGGETIEPDIQALMRGDQQQHLQTHLQTYWHIFLAERNGQVVGTASFTPLPHLGPAVAEGRRLFVLPEAQGLGIARALLNAAEEDARQRGFTTLYLDTFRTTEGEKPLALYRSLGFVECAPYNDYSPERTRFLVKQIA